MLGFTVVSTAVPLVTVKPLVRVTTSAPVVTDTLRAPAAAAASMFTTAVAVVAVFTVSEATVMPAPKLAVLVPCTQCVNCPVRFTLSFVCPCCPVLGFTVCSTGGFAVEVIVKLESSCSEPVATSVVRTPPAALPLIVTWAVALVGLTTVTGPRAPSAAPPTEVPAPKLATVDPCTNPGLDLLMVTATVLPGFPELGVKVSVARGMT